jgi:hypothetical protein
MHERIDALESLPGCPSMVRRIKVSRTSVSAHPEVDGDKKFCRRSYGRADHWGGLTLDSVATLERIGWGVLTRAPRLEGTGSPGREVTRRIFESLKRRVASNGANWLG